MNQQQQAQANIENLTSLWKLMGSSQTEHDNFPIHASHHFPHKVWLDWEHQQPESIDILCAEVMPNYPNSVFPIWHAVTDDDLAQLAQYNLAAKSTQTAMILPLNPKVDYPSDELSIQVINSEEAIQTWVRVASEAFDYTVHPPVIQHIADSPQITLVLAFKDNQAVGTGLLFDHSGVVGIHMVGVHPSQRRQGIARKIMHHLLNIAQQSDSRYATLQASSMGQPLYADLGFTVQFIISNCRY